MFVDINLLPKKEPKNVVFLLSIVIVTTMVVIAAAVFYILVDRAEMQIDSLEKELKQARALQAIEQQKLADLESEREINELNQAAQWAKDYPLKMVPLLRNMAELLPERGFIMNFSYAEDGTVTVSVQFDTSEEAAYYLKRLSEAKFVADVQLKSLSAVNENKENDEQQRMAAEQVMPRYLAQYEMHVHKQALEEKEKQP
ncbi:fimbrial protein [Parageobacillus thermoglucosidasius]|uniref:Fimbrial protein n=2 Tax=Parageobacillus thermoglucosidasius TaxID=1426 RepID=A0A1B7KXW3_PARTM|nr:fimbrial protein [Parageobacillus thermoglucosidasius]